MAYLDNHGLETLWTKIKATFASKVGNSAGDSSITIKLQNSSGSDLTGGSTTIASATTTSAGVMSKTDKSNLDGVSGTDASKANKVWKMDANGIPAWRDAPSGDNQMVKGNGTPFSSDAVVDFVEGANVTIVGSGANNTVTISATDTTYESKSASSGGTAVSLCTTGEKYTWNNKGTYSKPSAGIPASDLAESYYLSSNPSGYQTSSQVDTKIETAMAGSAKYKGTLGSEAEFTALANYKAGWYWVVSTSWTSASKGITLDAGNMIFCRTDGTTFSASNFDVIQSDIEAIPDSVINALS